MRSTEEGKRGISVRSIEYKGISYPKKIINIAEEAGVNFYRIVAPLSLKEVLGDLTEGDAYEIDSLIYFYLPQEQFDLEDHEIKEILKKNIEKGV